MSENVEEDDGDLFGDFTGGKAIENGVHQRHIENTEDMFSGFVPSQDEQQEAAANEAISDEEPKNNHDSTLEDSFGEFDSAAGSTEEKLGTPGETQAANSRSDVGENEILEKEAIHTVESWSEPIVVKNDDDENSSDWEPLSQAESEHLQNATGEGKSLEGAVPASGDQIDTEKIHQSADGEGGIITESSDANDSGNAETPERLTISSSTSNGQPKDANDDDFGDFSTPNQTDMNSSKAVEDPNALPAGDGLDINGIDNDDDAFGVFNDEEGIANTEEAATLRSSGQPVVIDNDAVLAVGDDNDEFGDFNTSNAINEETEETGPGQGQSDQLAAPGQTKATTSIEDDFEDDFGDFDSAQPSPPLPVSTSASSSSVAFNADFGFSTDTDYNSGSKVDFDPVMKKARKLLSKVFQSYAADKSKSDDGEDDDSPSNAMTVESLIASIDDKSTEMKEHNAKETLEAILKESKVKAKPPAFIVAEGDSSGSNSHFAVPIAGLEGFFESQDFRNRQHKGSACVLPDMLPIRLSPAESSTTENSASVVADERTDSHAELQGPTQQPQNTVAKLPPSESADEPEQHKSENVDRFLERIPNLSFMLESKLCLPAGQK